jgi:hypothetical protein
VKEFVVISFIFVGKLRKNWNIEMRVQSWTVGRRSRAMLLRKGTVLFLGVFVFFLVTVSGVSARPFRLGKLPDKGVNFSCGTCHVNPKGGGALNGFGKDYKKVGLKAGDKYTKELGEMDSDKDGIINDQEFEAGTNPGNPGSK